MNNLTFSKALLIQTRIIFIGVLVSAFICSWFHKDLTIFVYAIPASGGIYGANICFYLNKAKMENIFKGRISFLETKLKLQKEYDDYKELIEAEVQHIDDVINASIDDKMLQSLDDEKIDITS